MVIRLSNNTIHRWAITLNIAESAYAVALYGIFGDIPALRNFIIVFILMFDFCVLINQYQNWKVLIAILSVLGVLYGGTCLIYPENADTISGLLMNTVNYSLLAFLICVADDDTLYRSFKSSAYCIVLFCLVEPFTQYTIGKHDGYMVFGFRMMLGTVLLIYYYFQERKKMQLIMAVVGAVYILLFGNRSALLIPLICVLILWFRGRKNRGRFWKDFLVIAIVGSAVILVYSGALSGIADWLSGFGLSSRTISILQGENTVSVFGNNGRDLIWANCIDIIKANPFTGYGIGGDRNFYLMTEAYGLNVYAHNFILELMIDFGIPIAVVCMLFILHCCKKSYKLARYSDAAQSLLAVMFVSTGIKMLFSSTIWGEFTAYICLGLILHYFSNRNTNN